MCIVLFVSLLSITLAQTPIITESIKLVPSGLEADAQLWNAVAMSDDSNTLIVPVLKANANKGAVYVFERKDSLWTESAILTASDGAEGDQFGYAIAIDNDTIVVGADQHDAGGLNAGAVYVFTKTNDVWREELKLLAADTALADRFGAAVALKNNLLLVGSIEDDDLGINSGSVYLFSNQEGQWQETGKLIADDGDKNDNFGSSVAIHNNTVLVGAILDDTVARDTGSVYSFSQQNGAWVQDGFLVPEGQQLGDKLGRTLSVAEDVLVLGAEFSVRNQRTPEVTSGAAHVYRLKDGSWLEEAKLITSDNAFGDRMGWSVSTNGSYLVVGTPGDSDEGHYVGAAYLFHFDDSNKAWQEIAKFTASDASSNQGLGISSFISDKQVFVGGFDAVYVFELP